MKKSCKFCDALKWSGEYTGLWSSNGKIKLRSIEDPPEPLRSLIFGENIIKSKYFLTAIRKYNCSFQMTSFRRKQILDNTFMSNFKIQGPVYYTPRGFK